MKIYKLFAIILLAFFISNCDTKPSDNFSFDESKIKAQYVLTEKVELSVLNPEKKSIDSIVFFINNKRVGVSKDVLRYELSNQKLGLQNIISTTYFDGSSEKDSTRIEIISAIQPKLTKYKIVNTFAHDSKAYIEGLEFYNGFLYEGTGNGQGANTGIRGVSSMRKVDYKTGKVLQKVEYPEQIFGEGITILNGKIYQLTYQQNEVYVYDVNTFVKEKTLPYFKKMEGWGMTNDGKNIYMDDGSEKIHVLNPETFIQIDYLNVYSAGTKVTNINELEWVDGKIYSNIYQKNFMIRIDPKTGSVDAIVDLSDLEKKITKIPDVDVLNGIAYNATTKTFFVTGKNWDKMFEIKLEN